MKLQSLSSLVAITLAATFSACSTAPKGGQCPSSQCSTAHGKAGAAFDGRGLVTKADPKQCKASAKYILTFHGKTALLEASGANETKLAGLAGKRMDAHVVGKWEECGAAKCLCVKVTSVHSSPGGKSVSKGEAASKASEKKTEEKKADEKPASDKPAEAKPAESKAAESKPAESKPADEKPADKQ